MIYNNPYIKYLKTNTINIKLCLTEIIFKSLKSKSNKKKVK